MRWRRPLSPEIVLRLDQSAAKILLPQTVHSHAREERIPCPWAMTMMHVFWDGRVPRCPGDTEGEDTQGLNAWHASLTELWGALGSYRDLHLSRQFDALPDRCHTCKDWMTGAAERVRPESLERLTIRRAARRQRSA